MKIVSCQSLSRITLLKPDCSSLIQASSPRKLSLDKQTKKLKVASMCVLFGLLAGCSGIGGGEGLGGTRFYSLTPLAVNSNTAKANNPQLRIGVGPIGLSRLLRRPQIITRKSNTEIAMAEKHQWGGILKEDLSRTLVDNFSSLLGTENIEAYPWKFSFKPNYHVRIDIDQLDGELGQTVTLKARWRLVKGREEINIENTTITTQVMGSDYNAYVAAQSEALNQLTETISRQMLKN